MHGGARGSGAPVGNTNALKHGAYAGEAEWREMSRLLRQNREVLGHNSCNNQLDEDEM
jgi:hypothetical protein